MAHAIGNGNGDTLGDVNMPSQLKQCVALLLDKGIRVCVFDMDQTAVAAHSHGRLKRGAPLEHYLSRVSPDFQALVPLLHRHQIHLAIATHSDELEYGGHVQPTTHILGTELAQTMIRATFPPDIADAFFVVAYNPRVRKAEEEYAFKRYHMREIQRHFGVQLHELLFFDDVPSIVEDCQQTCGVIAVCVHAHVGFRLDDLMKNLA
jgi:hypothetical protein